VKFQVKYVFIFNSIAALILGLGFVFFPEILMTMIGFSNAADGPTAFRFCGIFVLGVSILTFISRNEEDSSSRQSIIFFLFIIYALMDVFHFIFCDLTNLMVGFVIGIDTLLFVAYGYFFLKKGAIPFNTN